MQTVTEQLAALAEIDELMKQHRLSYWLFGGWAVDFHALGRWTWPVDSFGDAEAELQRVHVCLVSRESLIADKSVQRADAESAAKDRADVAHLVAAPPSKPAEVGSVFHPK